jgi:hypothetical protein
MLKTRHLRHPLQAVRGLGSLFQLHTVAAHRSLEGLWRYKDDARFRSATVEQGLLNRSDGGQFDEQIFHRICESYRAATALPMQEAYEPTEWWKTLQRTSLQPVLGALTKGDVVALRQMYANFFRDSCSDGLVGKNLLLAPTLPRALAGIHQRAYLTETLLRFDRWRNLTSGGYDIQDLRGPEVGNPFGIVLDDVFIADGAEHQHYGAQRIADITGKSNTVIAEIGGGYGAMAYYLLRDSPQLKYWNFDLPESLALAAYNLLRSFPERRILLYGESSMKAINFDDYDIVLMPLPELSSLPPRFADMVFSSHAMSDLNEKALIVYLGHVQQLTRKYFLYQGMCGAASRLPEVIFDGCYSLTLTQKREYYLHGSSKRDHLQCELLYELL